MILNDNIPPKKNPELLVPLSRQAQGQAKQILKGLGLSVIKPKLFSPDAARIAKENETYEQVDTIGYDDIGTVFGLPVWDKLTIRTPRYTADNGDVIPDLSMEFEIALFEISNPRNIVRTSVQGRDGDVIEYMSNGNWNIQIKGAIFSRNANTPPINDLKKFIRIVTAPVSCDVESNLLNAIGVYNMVVLEPKIYQKEGMRNMFNYELSCISDTPDELS
jgi:hypothetical protein